ncbi:ribonuclease H-like domain-containing protein [Tanacetum coccineum]
MVYPRGGGEATSGEKDGFGSSISVEKDELVNTSGGEGTTMILELDPDVTLISKLDLSHPLHLHPNDSSTLTIVSIKLKCTENYNVWSCAMLLAFEGRNKTSFIDRSCRMSNTNEVIRRQRDRVWDELKETFDRVDGSVTFNLHHKINSLTKNGSPVAEYFNKLSTLWKQFDALVQLPRCTCHAAEDFKKHNQHMKLMQFLMGLDDTYMQLRSNILSIDPLPDTKGAYVLISSKESHRSIVTGSRAGSFQRAQSSVFNSSINNRIPEYSVTLVSVHKVARDIKFIVGFDESKCFLMSQDLMDVKIIRIGKQINGLYYFDNMEAKQTREPFSLSEHKSTGLGELVHLDLWGLIGLLVRKVTQFNAEGKNRAEKCVLIGYSSFKKRYKLFSLERKQFIFSRDVKFFEKVFPFKIKHNSVKKTSQDLDHVNFFNEIVHERPDTSYDDSDLNAQDQSDGSNSPDSSSPTIDLLEDDLGHPQGYNRSASEDEIVATSDPNTALSEDDV